MNRTAKKSLLAVGVIGVFVIYTLVLRGQKSAPVSVTQTPSKRSTATSTASTSSTTTTSPSPSSSPTASSGQYKNGTFTGSVENAFYGNIQVAVTISSGKISDVQFLSYPNDSPNSQNINQQAMPLLKQEAIQAQSAQIDGVTGASDTSQAFVQSLSNALSQAQA